jgi:hypothetical protein
MVLQRKEDKREKYEEDARDERKQELYTAEFKISDLRRSLNKERSTISGFVSKME